MSDKRFSIDELLSEQSNPSFQATIEKVEGKDDLVKVTPWTASAGCLCHLAINIPKASLDGATPTGDMHVCCGKSLKVVELHFGKEHTITLEDLFQQIHTKSVTRAQHSHHPQTAHDDRDFRSRGNAGRRRFEAIPTCLRLLIEDCVSCLGKDDVNECLYVANRNYEGCRRLE